MPDQRWKSHKYQYYVREKRSKHILNYFSSSILSNLDECGRNRRLINLGNIKFSVALPKPNQFNTINVSKIVKSLV